MERLIDKSKRQGYNSTRGSANYGMASTLCIEKYYKLNYFVKEILFFDIVRTLFSLTLTYV